MRLPSEGGAAAEFPPDRYFRSIETDFDHRLSQRNRGPMLPLLPWQSADSCRKAPRCRHPGFASIRWREGRRSLPVPHIPTPIGLSYTLVSLRKDGAVQSWLIPEMGQAAKAPFRRKFESVTPSACAKVTLQCVNPFVPACFCFACELDNPPFRFNGALESKNGLQGSQSSARRETSAAKCSMCWMSATFLRTRSSLWRPAVQPATMWIAETSR